MAKPANPSLYAKAKAKYKNMKHSAYRSGLIVKAIYFFSKRIKSIKI